MNGRRCPFCESVGSDVVVTGEEWEPCWRHALADTPPECPSCTASREEARLMGERLQEALDRIKELEGR